MALIEVREDQAVYSKAQIEELFKQKEEAETRDANQRILITQSIQVVNKVTKLFPGLADGRGLAGINFMGLMNSPDLKGLTPEFEKLSKMIEEYKSKNPVLI